ncbi:MULTISPECIES: hypothetical protein [unclassified Streptomyces]
MSTGLMLTAALLYVSYRHPRPTTPLLTALGGATVYIAIVARVAAQ